MLSVVGWYGIPEKSDIQEDFWNCWEMIGFPKIISKNIGDLLWRFEFSA
jgi:hypothetical protein